MRTLLLWISFVAFLQAVTVEQLFNIKTIQVKRETVTAKKSYNGYLQIPDDRFYTVTLTQSGFVRHLTAPNIYDSVVKGQKLLELYSPEIYKAQIELVSAMSVSSALAKQIETKLRLYDVEEKTIQMIRQQKKALKYLPFYSPYSGIVMDKKITEGSAVNAGTELYKIADLSRLWVVAKAYEEDRAWILQGEKVEITFSGSPQVHHAKIDFINPLIDSQNRTIDFRIVLDNSNGTLQPNSYATITLIKPTANRLVLPKSAVITKGDKHLVFVPREYAGEYSTKVIEAKRIDSTQFEILSGLQEGEVVVNNSLFLLDSDVAVNGGE